ncbi:unnamed protein product [Cladocopium goreaui]|uniref:Uncharacterized protein n=1 Tax=Cladocopium goreaui TaxID=2562237 RepID=A0A9P1CZT6_9DINO|nr:unnamed protein product [Cladocopium goreaui]
MADSCTLVASLIKDVAGGQSEAVLETLGALIESDEKRAVWWALRARHRLELGLAQEALEDTQEALWLEPRSPEVLTLRCRALAAVRQAAGGSSKVGATEALDAAKLAKQAKLNESQTLEVEAVVREEQERAAKISELQSAAKLAWKEGRNQEAKEFFSKLQRLDVDSASWPTALARIHVAEKKPEEAVKLSTDSLGRFTTGHAELHLVRAMAHHAMGNDQEARDDYHHAKRLGGLCEESQHDFEELKVKLGCSDANSRWVGPKAAKISSGFGYPKAKVAAPMAAEAAKKVAPSPRQTQPTQPTQPNKKKQPEAEAAPSAPRGETLGLLLRARREEEDGQLKTAKVLCGQVLRLSPNLAQAVLCIGRIELHNVEYENVLKLFSKVHPSVVKKGPGRVEALSLRAAAYERSKDWDAACDELEALVPLLPAAKLSPEEGWGPQPEQNVVLGRLARARWHAGRRKAATSLAEQLMESCPTELGACEVACAVLMERGDAAVALAVMVRCLVEHRATSAMASDLVCGVMRHCSAEELVHVISPTMKEGVSERSVAEVVGFIGLIMKERGDILEACRLYQRSVMMAPDHASLSLNLMHTYTLRRDDLRALAWGKRFLAQKPQLFGSFLAALDGKAVNDDAKIFDIKDFDAANEFHDALAIGLSIFKLLFLAQPRLFESKNDPNWLKRLRTMEIESHIVGPGVLSLMEDSWRRRSDTDYLDSTMLSGAQRHWQILRRLCAMLERCCKGHELHMTSVRNENAYFSCIKDILMQESKAPIPKAPASFKPMFIVGDSHVLSFAWQFLEFDDEHFMLVPLLITGAKIWHLREDSRFYTMFSFWDKLSIIPIESPVIFLLGEIDCRDGILRSVQKGKHDSFDDALRTVVNVYLDLLVQVRKKLPSNKLFVHPVPIALPETRFLTMAMNTLLETDWSQLSMEKARVKLLRVESIFVKDVPEHPENTDALTLAKLELLPELRLDGIHMSTVYVKSHLEAMEALKIWKLHESEPPLRYTQARTPMGRSSLRKTQTEQLQRCRPAAFAYCFGCACQRVCELVRVKASATSRNVHNEAVAQALLVAAAVFGHEEAHNRHAFPPVELQVLFRHVWEDWRRGEKQVVQSFAKLQGVGFVPERQRGGLLPSSRFQLILID